MKKSRLKALSTALLGLMLILMGNGRANAQCAVIPNLDFSIIPISRCAPVAFYNFLAQNVPANASIFWDVNNTGTYTSNPSNPGFVNNVWSTAGIKTVNMMVVTANNDTCYRSKTLTVFAQPVINIVIAPDNVFTTCDTVVTKSFSLNPPQSGNIFWTIDGVTYVGQSVNNYKFLNSGTSSIDVQVTDANGCSNTSTITRNVLVGPKFTGDFTSPDTAACLNPTLTTTFTPTVNFFGVTPDSVKWELPGSSTPVVNSTTLTPVVATYSNPGVYNAKLTLYKNGCQTVIANKTNYMNLLTKPVVDFKFIHPVTGLLVDTLQICNRDTVRIRNTTPNRSALPGTWTWNTNGAIMVSSNDSIRTVVYQGTGSYSVRLFYNNRCNADTLKQFCIRVKGPQVNINLNAINRDACVVPYTVKFSHTTQFPNTGVNSVQWTFYAANGTTVLGTSNLDTPSFTYNATGTYRVLLTATNSLTGCVSTLNTPQMVRLGASNQVPAFTGTVATTNPNGACLPPNASITYTANINNQGFAIDSLIWYLPGSSDSLSKVVGSNTKTVTYSNVGSFRVRLYAYSRGCQKLILDSNNFTKIVNKPVVKFTLSGANPDSIVGCVGVPMKIINTTQNSANLPGGFTWSIPNSTIDSSDNNRIIVRFDSPGRYNVQLTYEGACTVDTIRNNVLVVRGPLALIDQNIVKSSCQFPFTVNFTSTNSVLHTSGTNTYAWTFYDVNGTTVLGTSTSPSPSRNYVAFGDYNVRLKISNTATGCTSTDSQVAFVKIRKIQLAMPAAGPAAGCAPFTFNTTNYNQTTHQSVFNYSWEIIKAGTVVTSASGRFPSIVIQDPGVYDVRLIVTDDLNCSDTIRRNSYITVNGANGSITPPSGAACISLSSGTYTGQFSVNNGLIIHPPASSSTYTWSVSPITGVTIAGGTTATPNITFTKPGYYDITVNINAANCSRSITYTAFLVGTKASFTIPSTPICYGVPQTITNTSTLAVGGSSKYKWTTIPAGAATITPNDSASAPNFSPNTNSPFTIQLLLTNDNGCQDTARRTVNPAILTGNFSTVDTQINCAPRVVKLIATPANMVSYNWTFIDTVGSVPRISTINAVSDTTYKSFNFNGYKNLQLIMTDQYGCIDTIYKQNYIRIQGPQPDFAITNNKGCEPLTVSLQDISRNVTTFNFSYGDGSSTAYVLGANNVKTYRFPNSASNVDSFKFNVSYFATDGFCVFTRFDSVVVYPKAKFRISADDTVGCFPHTVRFRDSSNYATMPGSTFLWDFGDGTTDTTRNPIKTYNTPGNYTVKLSIQTPRGCVNDTTWRYKIRVQPHPTAKFGVTDTIACYGQPFSFLDSSVVSTGINGGAAINRYKWDFGQTNITSDTSIQQNPQYVYSAIGFFSPNLIIFDTNGCSDTLSRNNLVHVLDTVKPTNNDIRYVTVRNNNLVHLAWDPSSTLAPKFSRYRMSKDSGAGFNLLFNNYTRTDTSYDDPAVNAAASSISYSLDVIDTCNIASLPGVTHKTILLSVTQGSAGQNLLNWTPYVGWSNVASYEVFRSDSTTGIPVSIATLPGTSTSYSDNNLCANFYCYYVVATKAGAPLYTSSSNQACSRPISASNPAPSQLTSVSVENNSGIRVNWSNPTQPAQTIIIEKKTGSGNWAALPAIPGNQTSFLDANVDVQENVYQYRMSYSDTCGFVNTPSNEGRNILLKVAVEPTTKRDIILNWTPYTDWSPNSVASYEIYQEDPANPGTFLQIGTRNSSDTTFADTNCLRFGANFESFCYKVIARNSATPDSSVSNIGCTIFPSTIYLPNAFTPDSKDNINREYHVVGMSIKDFHLWIYDRFGNLVFETTSPRIGWNGKVMNTGSDCDPGVYHAVMEARGADRKPFRKQTDINLLR